MEKVQNPVIPTVGVSPPHLRTETYPVSETEYRMMDEVSKTHYSRLLYIIYRTI
jgi:hypothetical protein